MPAATKRHTVERSKSTFAATVCNRSFSDTKLSNGSKVTYAQIICATLLVIGCSCFGVSWSLLAQRGLLARPHFYRFDFSILPRSRSMTDANTPACRPTNATPSRPDAPQILDGAFELWTLCALCGSRVTQQGSSLRSCTKAHSLKLRWNLSPLPQVSQRERPTFPWMGLCLR